MNIKLAKLTTVLIEIVRPFHPLEVVFRYRDPQLQVGENINTEGDRFKG